MTIEQLSLGLLTLLLIASQVFWAKLVLSLNNRLMSRSFYDFEQAQALSRPKVQTPPANAPVFDIEDERQARDANSLMGLI